MTVHLPEGYSIERWADETRWEAREQAFGRTAHEFWRWQEFAAEAAWDLGLSLPPWPPSNWKSFLGLPGVGARWLSRRSLRELARLAPDFVRPVSARLPQAPPQLRRFIDAQLLISAQTTSEHANSLYAAAALDMPRRGAVQVRGGAGSLAKTLVSAVESHGGRVLYRQRVQRVKKTKRGYWAYAGKQHFAADHVIFNLTSPDILSILDQDIRTTGKLKPDPPSDAWGAFMLYLGVDQDAWPDTSSHHHQIVGPGELSETASAFVSISPEWDGSRAPRGRRALTISTHTRLEPWWRLHRNDQEGFQARKDTYQSQVRGLVERQFPGLFESAELILPATPLSFARFVGRSTGWVGGIPQTHLLRANSPRVGKGLWMVGDSIFPGQSVAAVALGGLRVASDVLGIPVLSRASGTDWTALKTTT
jgi:phytoene dehydrogenase-like protein